MFNFADFLTQTDLFYARYKMCEVKHELLPYASSLILPNNFISIRMIKTMFISFMGEKISFRIFWGANVLADFTLIPTNSFSSSWSRWWNYWFFHFFLKTKSWLFPKKSSKIGEISYFLNHLFKNICTNLNKKPAVFYSRWKVVDFCF